VDGSALVIIEAELVFEYVDDAEMSVEDGDVLEAAAAKVEDKHSETTIDADVGSVSLSDTTIIETTIVGGRSTVLV